ncbi:hypothetical protein G6F63_014401 [Rhizopus arrhizus]|nr:hypothetical protein G6F63_014401 [Rhizopus arrhizus]
MVWIVPEGNAQSLRFHAISDSAIVSGLIFLALRVSSGRSAQEILDTEPSYIQDIGLARHLSPTRSNGVAAMLAFIRETAQAQLQRDPSGANLPPPKTPRWGCGPGPVSPGCWHTASSRCCPTRWSRSPSAGTSTKSPAIRSRWAWSAWPRYCRSSVWRRSPGTWSTICRGAGWAWSPAPG